MSLMTERAWLINADNAVMYPHLGLVDHVITDPPYGAEVHSKDRWGRDPNGWLVERPVPFDALQDRDMEYLGVFACQRVTGWTILFSQDEHIARWQDHMVTFDGHGTRYFRSMVWIKTNAKPNMNGDGPGKGHEMMQAYWSGHHPGRPRWNGGGKQGVFIHPRPARPRHPTEKPLGLMRELVTLFTTPGDVILDPYMGSGSTGVAALQLGRRFIGIERNPDYFAYAEDRIIDVLAHNEITEVPTESRMPTLFGGPVFGSTGTRRKLSREARENAENAKK